jgi:hypothetical protein
MAKNAAISGARKMRRMAGGFRVTNGFCFQLCKYYGETADNANSKQQWKASYAPTRCMHRLAKEREVLHEFPSIIQPRQAPSHHL